MEKPIIATALRDIFIKSEAWDNAHELWFKSQSKELQDESVLQYIGKENYFEGVDIVMKRLYPNLNDEERTKKAREMFFDSVIENIKNNPDLINKEAIDYFNSLKNNYQIALITTNTLQAVNKIFSVINVDNLFDIIETSLSEEKDDIKLVFNRFINKYEKPKFYLGTNTETLKYLKEKGIETFNSVEKLKDKIN